MQEQSPHGGYVRPCDAAFHALRVGPAHAPQRREEFTRGRPGRELIGLPGQNATVSGFRREGPGLVRNPSGLTERNVHCGLGVQYASEIPRGSGRNPVPIWIEQFCSHHPRAYLDKPFLRTSTLLVCGEHVSTIQLPSFSK